MSEKKKNRKIQKLKPRLPRGFPDRNSRDIRATEDMLDKIKLVYERFGFEPIETPMFEYTDALGKFLPDTDRPNTGVFSLQDDDDQWISLRYDLTAPLARHIAENFNIIHLPYRSYRSGWVFRNEKPGPGRFRQFMQFDADIIGAPGIQADAEMCMMMADTMEALGIARGDYVVRVNNRKILDGLMQAIGLGGDDNKEQRLHVLRAIDKLDKFGIEGVRFLLGDGRKDDSGDFTPGAGLNTSQSNTIMALLQADNIDDITNGEAHSYDKAFEQFDVQNNKLFNEGVEELLRIRTILTASHYILQNGCEKNRIKIDPSCVRGLEYYTGPIYEAELLLDVVNEKGQNIQFGSVGGGGRYDGLVSRFMGQSVPATGFSIGVSRLMTALKNLGKLSPHQERGPILITIMDRSMMADYGQIAKKLRDELNPLDEDGQPVGPLIPVELYQGNPKNFGNQLKYADRRNCPIAIIQGSDEKERGEVQIKDLIEGRRLSSEIEDNSAWRAARPAQVSIPINQMVQKVADILMAQQAVGKTQRLHQPKTP